MASKTETQKPKYSRKGIPTKFRNRQYRSRLEARWAAFFDLVGWQYEYEPYDLDGWIPDFVLLGRDCYNQKTEILVEVKPYVDLHEFMNDEPEEDAWDKIYNAVKGTDKDNKEILLLGCTITSDEFAPGSSLGWLGEYDADHKWFEAAIITYHDNKYGFVHSQGDFTDRITGFYEGGHYYDADTDAIHNLWNEAGNEVQ